MSGPIPPQFYVKLGAACFVLGGCMELFMIKTGFYDMCVDCGSGGEPCHVTRNEAERWESHLDEQLELRQRVAAALAARGVDVPEPLQPHLNEATISAKKQ